MLDQFSFLQYLYLWNNCTSVIEIYSEQISNQWCVIIKNKGLSMMNNLQHFSGWFFHNIHPVRWTIWFLARNIAGWLTDMGCHKKTYFLSGKEKFSLSLFAALFQSYPICLSVLTDRNGLCTCCSLAASFSCWLSIHRICRLHEPGWFS